MTTELIERVARALAPHMVAGLRGCSDAWDYPLMPEKARGYVRSAARAAIEAARPQPIVTTEFRVVGEKSEVPLLSEGRYSAGADHSPASAATAASDIFELIESLELNSEMLKDGYQRNLTELWHSEVVKDAAKDCAKASVAIQSLTDRIASLERALTEARAAIASLDEFALGGVDMEDVHTGESVGQYGIRDELLSTIDAALSTTNRLDDE